MPCANVHLLLAGRVLRGWAQAPSTAPVPFLLPDVRASFLAGALAPDAGFVPGTDRTVSELAHYVLPGDLTRNLLASAVSEADHAFALGWATHVLGDVELHPEVGRAVGERRFGDPLRRVNTADDVETHVSLEVGLDLAVEDAEGAFLVRPPDRSWEAGVAARHLARALELTYGRRWSRSLLHRDQAQGAFFMRHWRSTLAVVRRAWPAGRPVSRTASGPLVRLLSWGRSLAPEASAPRGLLAPSQPPAWLVERVLERAETFPERFGDLLNRGLTPLGNRNLETGTEQPRGSGHPATDAAWARLDQVQPGRGSDTARREKAGL